MKSYIEALLFASPEPLTQSQVNGIFPGEDIDLNQIVNELNSEYNDLKKGLLEKFGKLAENPQESDIDTPKEVETEQYSYTVPPENRDDFLKEMQDLINIEHDLETEKLPFPQKIDEGITVADIDVLDIFFDFGFEDSKSAE